MTSNSVRDRPTGSRPLVVQITTVPQTLYRLFPAAVAFLKANGYLVKAVCSAGTWVSREQAAERLEIEIGEIPLRRSLSPWADVRALVETTRILRRWKPDIVHCHTPKGGLIGGIAGWLARVPCCVYTVRGLPHLTAKGLMRWALLWSERIACRLAHRIILVSPSVRDELISLRIGDVRKMVVPGAGSAQGVDADGRFNPKRVLAGSHRLVRTELRIPVNAFVIGFVGRLTRDKGVVELSETWQNIREMTPDSHLIIAGADQEPRRGSVDSLLSRLGNDERVHIVGNVDAIETYLQAMDMLLFPSYREGFSNAILEASAMALPTVAFDVVGSKDGVRDGETGFLVPVHDTEALTERISRLYHDKNLCHVLGQNARAWVLRDFQPMDRLLMLEAEYARLLAEKGV